MRISMLVALTVAATGCGEWEPLTPWSDQGDWWEDDGWADGSSYMEPYLRGDHEGFEQRSSLGMATRGLALGPSGDMGVAGMNTMTCEVYTWSGMVGLDLDPSNSEEVEEVDDAVGGPNGTVTVLATTESGVHVTSGDTLASTSVDVQDVIESRFYDAGVVVLHDTGAGCGLSWIRNGGSDVTVEIGECGDALAVDPVTGTVYVEADGDIVQVDQDGQTTVIGTGADLIAFDTVTQLVYAAELDGSEVRAWQLDGEVAWTTALDGDVQTLEAMGSRGDALVGLSTVDGGALVILDGANGAVEAAAQTTEAPQSLEFAGGMIAVTTPDNAHFIQVTTN